MKIRVRNVMLSVVVGVALSALSQVEVGATASCPDPGPSLPPAPSPCSKPANGCSGGTQQGLWQALCCKNTGTSGCYWVEGRVVCCSGTWKFEYRDGTMIASSCDVDHTCL